MMLWCRGLSLVSGSLSGVCSLCPVLLFLLLWLLGSAIGWLWRLFLWLWHVKMVFLIISWDRWFGGVGWGCWFGFYLGAVGIGSL